MHKYVEVELRVINIQQVRLSAASFSLILGLGFNDSIIYTQPSFKYGIQLDIVEHRASLP